MGNLLFVLSVLVIRLNVESISHLTHLRIDYFESFFGPVDDLALYTINFVNQLLHVIEAALLFPFSVILDTIVQHR